MNDKLYLEMVTLHGNYRDKVKSIRGEISEIDKRMELTGYGTTYWEKLYNDKKFAVQHKIDYEKFADDLEKAITRGIE
jgi:hypothetical protein